MAEQKDPFVSAIELHEEFVQHFEAGGKRMRRLALTTVVAGATLSVLYFSQLVVLPVVLGQTTETVSLTDPALMALEAVVLVLTILWLYSGLKEYSFARRVEDQVREIRDLESKVAERQGLSS